MSFDDFMIPHDADYIVRGFNRQNQLLLETWHRGESSKDLEVSVWRARYFDPRDNVARVEVADRQRCITETYPPWPYPPPRKD